MIVKDIQVLAGLQIDLVKNPHHYTFEKIQADLGRQGWNTAAQIVAHAEGVGFDIRGFHGKLTDDNQPGAKELAQMVNYVLEEF